MRNYKLIIISAVLLCLIISVRVKAQVATGSFGYYEDALRYSQGMPVGSARTLGIAGAQSSLGADMGGISVNPAGLGFYNRSEFSISPSLSFGSSNSTFINNPLKEFSTNLNISNLGIVLSKTKDNIVPGKWRGGSFGISFVRTNNFNNTFSYSGTNRYNSIIDSWVESANGIDVSTIEGEVDDNGDPTSIESLAYSTYLLSPESDNRTYYNLIKGEEVLQEGVVKTTGGQYQWNFAYGGNLMDKLYIGANVGLASFRYKREKTHSEKVLTQNDEYDDLQSFTLNDNLEARGSGINFSLGLIYRVSDAIRLGGSIVTPTYYYSIKETFNSGITADFNNEFELSDGTKIQDQNVSMAPGVFNYQLTTPLKLTGGASFFIGKKGFISADVDYVNYNRATLQTNEDGVSMSADNRTINNIYKSAVNLRVGGEYRFDIFRIRAGYALYGDPINNQDNIKRNTQYITGGAGLRLNDFYLDLAVVNSSYKSGFSPYVLNDGTYPSAQVKNNYTNATFTLGFFF